MSSRSIDIEANGNKASGKANQAIANQNSSGSSISCCDKRTAIIVIIGTAIIVAIVLGVGIGVATKNQRDAE